jgi:hypothetical protein
MSTPLDYTQAPDALLLELINYDNNTNLTLDMVSLSVPLSVSGGARNTKVTVTAKPGSPYADNQDVFYNRINLSALGTLEFLSELPYDAPGLLAAINAEKGAYLYASDLEEFELSPVIQLGELKTFNLSAKPTSIRWIGTTPLSMVCGLPNNLSDFHVLMNTTLPEPGYFQSPAS